MSQFQINLLRHKATWAIDKRTRTPAVPLTGHRSRRTATINKIIQTMLQVTQKETRPG